MKQAAKTQKIIESKVLALQKGKQHIRKHNKAIVTNHRISSNITIDLKRDF